MSVDAKPLDRDMLRAYLDQTTFRFRPKAYDEKYPDWPGSVGLEIEMLPVFAAPAEKTGIPGAVPLQGEGQTSATWLAAESLKRGWKPEYTDGDGGRQLLLRIELDDGDNISFEPGGQVEFSSKPYPCLSEAIRRMRKIQTILDDLYAAHGAKFVQIGINPWHTVPELGLQMPKGRYRAMDRYYSAISEYGQRMMRQTCTIQVNLDFGSDEETLAKRYLASQLLSPFATATFAYSTIVDRKLQADVKCFRSRIWRHTDPSHTGLPGLHRIAEKMTREECIDTYLDFVLNATVVFVAELGYKVPEVPVRFGDWLERPISGIRPTIEDFATHLTLMFPEVRPRGFLELRSIDCQARAFEAVPGAYLTGLLYDPKTLDQVLEVLLPHRDEIPELLRVSEIGLGHPTLATLSKKLMALAASGFANLDSSFREACSEQDLLVFKDHYTDRARSPADDVLDQVQKDGKSFMTYQGMLALEKKWAALLNCS